MNDFIEKIPEPVFSDIPEMEHKYNVPSSSTLEKIRLASRTELEKRKHNIQSYPSRIADDTAVYQETTVSEQTLEAYAKISNRLYRKWLKENGYDINIPFEHNDAVLFVRWMIARKPEWKAKTWRLYRQSVYVMLTDYMASGQGNYIEQAIEMIQEDSIVRAKDAKTGKKNNFDVADGKSKDNTSSLKYKKFPINDLKKVIAWLRFKSRSSMTHNLEIWMRATLLTGLRPSEWKGTDLITIEDSSTLYGRRVYLHVICAKATNGRGFDVVRTLDLSTLPNTDIDIIREQSQKSLEYFLVGDFNEYYRDCADLLKRACTTLWPKRKMRYSLYSCRHQAIANWKSSGMSKVEIAVLAGHASHETAGEAYGRKNNGWKGLTYTARPTKEQLEIAQQRQQDYIDRILEKRTGMPGKKPVFSI